MNIYKELDEIYKIAYFMKGAFERWIFARKNNNKLVSAWRNQNNDFVLFVCLFFVLILYVPSTIFQLYRGGSSWVEPVII